MRSLPARNAIGRSGYQSIVTSAAGPLAVVYLLLVAYASLYPFERWSWPAGADVGRLLLLPWPPWRDRFDEFRDICEVVYLPRTPAISTTALIEKISSAT